MAGEASRWYLVHGLMGRGTTWSRQLPWLTRLGTVYTYDAPWHRGRDVDDPHPISTERFVADLADAVSALGAPATAGRAFDGCTALLVSGRRTSRIGLGAGARGYGAGLPWSHHRSVGAVVACTSGRIRLCGASIRRIRASRRAVFPGCLRPHRHRLAAARPYVAMDRDRRRVGHPGLLDAMAGGPGAGTALEAGNSVTPPGQMHAMAKNRFSDNIFSSSRSPAT